MLDPISGVANIVQAGEKIVENLGKMPVDIINASLRSKYSQQESESDQAYKARLMFMEEQEKRKMQHQKELKEAKAREKTEQLRIKAELKVKIISQKLAKEKPKLKKR